MKSNAKLGLTDPQGTKINWQEKNLITKML